MLFRQSKRPRVAIPVLLLLLALGSLFAGWLHRSSKIRWARTQALPQIAQLIEREKLGEAYALAVKAERYIPDDPMLGKFWTAISWSGSIHTIPSGVSVFRRNYNAPDSPWELVGRSPIKKRRMPLVDSQWKFELTGFTTTERFTVVLWGDVLPSSSLSVVMDEEAKTPPGMIHQTDRFVWGAPASLQTTPAGLLGLPGFEDLQEVLLGDYWIDRYEVTNNSSRNFSIAEATEISSTGSMSFAKTAARYHMDRAMTLFRDTTGRPGPATWEQGDYRRGQEDFPISGVSWYEAAAYAEFAGKSLPTIYHWATAASLWASASIVAASNFAGQGPARVGSYRGISWFGAHDMSGNVKEWCWNEAGSGRRFVLGGAWDEPAYMFNDADARSPFERSANIGFRCAKYRSTGPAGKAAEPLTLQARNFSREKPVSDALFRVYKSL